ncbi:MAG: hypothetical protein EBY41_01055 [Proteobacteria bacterium]|jgi:hypothetical protein|nr:hypothetical protein [Pseudomonadota bacterium]
MDAFEAYKQYLAIKMHFNDGKYDYFTYNGKTNASKHSFDVRKDKYYFHKLAKQKDVNNFIVANLVYGNDPYVVEMINNEDCDEYYNKFMRIKESLSYVFRNDMQKIDDFNGSLAVEDGQHPDILRKYLKGEIELETLIILDSLVGCFNHWNKKISDPIVWPSLYTKATKYKPFLSFDRDKFKKILVALFK